MNEDRLKDVLAQHIVDQALAAGLATGAIRHIGQDENGKQLYTLTGKGTAHIVVDILEGYIDKADAECRDFSPEEKQELLFHIENLVGILKQP